MVDKATRPGHTAIEAAVIDCRWQAATAEVVLGKVGMSWMNVDDTVTLDSRQHLRGDTYAPLVNEQDTASDAFHWDKPLQHEVREFAYQNLWPKAIVVAKHQDLWPTFY